MLREGATTEEIIEELKTRGSSPGLKSERALLLRLGNPERGLPVVHIAGTNGKGSVCAYLDSILRCAGYRTGRFTSPTISCYAERFQIDGKCISREELDRQAARLLPVLRAMEEEGENNPTLFEAETALAFSWFAQEKVDFALIETGMGGLLDATNVIESPRLTVITSVSLDHCAFLGDTLEEIAAQKAGILKKGAEVIAAPNPEAVRRMIASRAAAVGAPCTFVEEGDGRPVSEEYDRSRFLWGGNEYETFLPGRHQIANAVTALTAASRLTPDQEALRRGVREARWPGRLELLKKRPLLYRDGAHNPDGAAKLAAFLQKHFTNRRILYIMGVLKDKDYPEMVARLLPLSKTFFLFPPRNARGLDAGALCAEVARQGGEGQVFENVNEALRAALRSAGKDDVLVVCGSLSFMEEMEESLWAEE